MRLEERIKNEVNSWGIEKTWKGENIDLAKSVCYGMGEHVTQKVIKFLGSKIADIDTNTYQKLNLREAIKRFRLDYVLYHLSKNDFNMSATAREIDSEKSGSMRVKITNMLKENNLNISELRKRKHEQDLPNNWSYEKILGLAEKEVKRYEECINYKLFDKFISINSEEIARRFVRIIIEPLENRQTALTPYLTLDFRAAQESFISNYLKEQFFKNKENSRKAAEASGIRYGSYRMAFSKRGIRVSDLISAHKTSREKTYNAPEIASK